MPVFGDKVPGGVEERQLASLIASVSTCHDDAGRPWSSRGENDLHRAYREGGMDVAAAVTHYMSHLKLPLHLSRLAEAEQRRTLLEKSSSGNCAIVEEQHLGVAVAVEIAGPIPV